MHLLSGVEQDFHRPQTSPGGYEWWHFDGRDQHSGFSFTAQFYAGNPFSPYYQQALRRYLRESRSPLVKAPTLAPPQPLDFCGVAFRLFKHGAPAGEFFQEFTPGQLKASEEQAAVLLGPNRFHWDASGDPPGYHLSLQGAVGRGRTLRARFFFIPEPLPALPAESFEDFPAHSWVLAAPRCRVEGRLQWCGPEGDVTAEVPWEGRGYHDHHFGAVPLDRFLRSWHFGHAELGDATAVYSLQQGLDGEPKGLWMTLEPRGAKVWEAAFEPSRKRRNFFLLPYASRLSFTDFDRVRVDHQTVLADGPASLWLEDRVRWDREDGAREGLGMSCYLDPPRLSNPLFFPMLKGKTQVLAKPSADGKGGDFGDVSTTRPDLPPK